MARTGNLAGREVLVDVERHERDHPVGDRHVEVRTFARRLAPHERGEDRDHGLHAAAGRVADGRAGQRRAALGAPARTVEVAADREVVDVVAGPLRTRAGLAVAARRAVDDAGVHGAHVGVADAEAVDHTRPEALDHHVGACRRAAGTHRVRMRPSGRAAPVPCPGDRCTRRTAARSARPTASAAGRPSRRARRSRRASETCARPDRRSTGRAPSHRRASRADMSSRSSSGGRARRAMMFFWTSDEPPPIVSITV